MSSNTQITAAQLSRLVGLPRAPEPAEFRQRLAEAVAGRDWIIDGSFAELAFDLTLGSANMMVAIDRPRTLCQRRILWRSAFQRGGTRPDLPEGCPEKFDFALMREAWRYNFERRPAIEAERLKHGAGVPVVRLRSDRDIEGFLRTV